MEDVNKKRVHELIAQIAAQKDHDKFTALVAELNRLLDSDQPIKKAARKDPLKVAMHDSGRRRVLGVE